GGCRQAQARQACTAAARLLDVLSVHRGTPDLRHADRPIRPRQGEDTKKGAKEGTEENAQEDARLTLLHRRPRLHDLDLRRLCGGSRSWKSRIPPKVIFWGWLISAPQISPQGSMAINIYFHQDTDGNRDTNVNTPTAQR